MTYLLTQMALYMLCALILGVILGWLIWGRLAERLRNCQADRAKLSAELKSRGDNSEDRARIAKLEAELEANRQERADLRHELESLRDESASNAAAAAAAATATAAPLVSSSSTAPGQPQGLAAARNGHPDDLKLIKGVGPKLERMLHGMGYFHFDQIAAWTASDVAWVDENLEGFTGRVSRDEWVRQARDLAGR